MPWQLDQDVEIRGQVFAEMVERWKLKQPLIVAHDFGGATTLRAHLLHGCEFERHILMNVVAMRLHHASFKVLDNIEHVPQL
ncbi:MAG: hypothetical protein AAF151_25735 [Cyanobacteria bacterium J06656_5]